LETKNLENRTDWTEKTAKEVEEERKAGTQEKDAAELGTLTDKVLYLMEKISEYGFLTMAEIHRVYTNKTYAYDVMKRLRKQGWIADFDTAMRPATGHYLTPKGYLALVKLGRLRVSARFRLERYTPFIFKHRMACARVGLALEKHPLVREFLPESLLWKRRKNETEKMCDGEFMYGVPDRVEAERVGLEVELTLKNKDRLAESFDQLGRRELDQVWWVCGDATVLRALRHQVMDRSYGWRVQRHFFCLLDDFLAARQHRVCLMDVHGQEFSTDPAGPTLLPREPKPPRPVVEARPDLSPQVYVFKPVPAPSVVAAAPAAVEVPWVPPPKPARQTLRRIASWTREVLYESGLVIERLWDVFGPSDDGPRYIGRQVMFLVFVTAVYAFHDQLPQPWDVLGPRHRRPVTTAHPSLPWVERDLLQPWAHSEIAGATDVKLSSQGERHHSLTMSLCPATWGKIEVASVRVLDAAGRRRTIDNHVRDSVPNEYCVDGGVDFDGPLTPGLRLVMGLQSSDPSASKDVLEIPMTLLRP